jgi:hypothetical protein
VHLLLLPFDSALIHRYDPFTHALIEQQGTEAASCELRQQVSQAINPGKSTLILLAAEPGRYCLKYENFESLIWRDAGAMIGATAIAAHALNLTYCPLGLTGESAVALMQSQGKLLGVGAAAIGSK